MATKPPVVCPLCNTDLDAETDLESHLLDEHTKKELAESAIAIWEEQELGDYNR